MPQEPQVDDKTAQSNYVDFLNRKISTEKDPVAKADYQTQLAGASKALAKYDKQVVTGPDGKKYSFSKGISQARINKYFTSKGIVGKQTAQKPSAGLGGITAQPTTPTTVIRPTTPPVMGQAPAQVPTQSESGKPYATKGLGALDWLVSNYKLFVPGSKPKELSTSGHAFEAATTAMPAAGGYLGSVATETKGTPVGMAGAFLGGAAGEAARELTTRLVFNEGPSTSMEAAYNILKQGAEQAALEAGGRLTGAIFFKLLNRFPHVTLAKGDPLIDGIPLTPSERNGGGKIMKYVEDLFANLAPSAKDWADFRTRQSKIIGGKLDDLVGGFSRFKGDSEVMGTLLQGSINKWKIQAYKDLSAWAAQNGIKSADAMWKTPQGQAVLKEFNNELMRRIARTEKPELIGGWFRTGGQSGIGYQQMRDLEKMVVDRDPKLWGKVQATVLRDIISTSEFGSIDPVAKARAVSEMRYSGKDLETELNKMGEKKLTILLGQQGYDDLKHFMAMTKHVGGSTGAGPGKWVNLGILLPWRNVGSAAGAARAGVKVGMFWTVVNRLSKVMLDPAGMKLYENRIRAIGQQAPRAIKLATDEVTTYNERIDKEYDAEKQEELEKFMKEHPGFKPQQQQQQQ